MSEDVPKGCVCEMAGFCHRHGVEKTEHLFSLCRNHPGYFELWEDGRGPLQPKSPKERVTKEERAKQKVVTGGPGTELKKELAKLGFSTTSGCGCSSKSNKMDKWGAEKCREKIEEITDWLVDAAKKNSWLTRIAVSAPVVGDVARYEIKQMILRAIERAESSSQGAAAS